MPKGIPLTDEELERRRHDILARTVHLFLENGFRETSIREIAEVAGMGKSSLYDYFRTKDDILLWAMQDEIVDLTIEAKAIAGQPLPAIERLRQIMEMHLEVLVSKKEFYTKLSFEIQRLALESQKRIQVRRHAYQDLIRQVVEEGVQEGSFRPVDTLLVARLLITALTPTIFTSRPTGTPKEMLDTAFSIILQGIQA